MYHGLKFPVRYSSKMPRGGKKEPIPRQMPTTRIVPNAFNIIIFPFFVVAGWRSPPNSFYTVAAVIYSKALEAAPLALTISRLSFLRADNQFWM